MGSRDSVFPVCVIPVSLNALGYHVFQDFRLCPPVECRAKYRRIPKVTGPVSFGYVPSFLPSFLPPSFLPSSLPTYLPSLLLTFLPSSLPTFLPSFFLPSHLLYLFIFLTFLPSFRPSIHHFVFRTNCCRQQDDHCDQEAGSPFADKTRISSRFVDTPQIQTQW